jgi:hypothetical protein
MAKRPQLVEGSFRTTYVWAVVKSENAVMILTMLMYLGIALLALKAIWNLSVPYRLAQRPYRDETGATDPISFEIGLDVLLLCLTLITVPFSTADYLFCSKFCMAVICVALPVGSIVHFLIVGFICGWVKAMVTGKKRNGDAGDP